VVEAADGWTLLTAPGNLSAQYEHTMIITRGAPDRRDDRLSVSGRGTHRARGRAVAAGFTPAPLAR
jgi:hypothetical protein